MTDIKIDGIKNIYLIISFDKDNKNIWNKDFHFYLSSKPCGTDDFYYFFTNDIFAKMWRIAKDSVEIAQEILLRGGHFPLATITKGKVRKQQLILMAGHYRKKNGSF